MASSTSNIQVPEALRSPSAISVDSHLLVSLMTACFLVLDVFVSEFVFGCTLPVGILTPSWCALLWRGLVFASAGYKGCPCSGTVLI
jgi:hypothetical protein